VTVSIGYYLVCAIIAVIGCSGSQSSRKARILVGVARAALVIIIIVSVATPICVLKHKQNSGSPPTSGQAGSGGNNPGVGPIETICSTGLGGRNVSVINNAVEWSVSYPSMSVISQNVSLVKAEFHFEFTGAPENTYLIRVLDRLDLMVSSVATTLTIAPQNPPGLYQSWVIQCTNCSSTAAATQFSGCNIIASVGENCVQTPGTLGNGFELIHCDGQDHQSFELWTPASN